MGQLLEAQVTDETLVQNELDISRTERDRLNALPKGSEDRSGYPFGRSTLKELKKKLESSRTQ